MCVCVCVCMCMCVHGPNADLRLNVFVATLTMVGELLLQILCGGTGAATHGELDGE